MRAVAAQNHISIQARDRTYGLFGVGSLHTVEEQDIREAVIQAAPDRICVDLDAARYKTLSEAAHWDDLRIQDVIREKLLSVLILNLLVATYQRKYGKSTEILPGSEFLDVIKFAEELGIPVSTCDRDIHVTFQRAWQATSPLERLQLVSAGFKGLFRRRQGDEFRDVMPASDVLTELKKDLVRLAPRMRPALMEELDHYFAHQLQIADGERIFAVVGAGRVEAVRSALLYPMDGNINEIAEGPRRSRARTWLTWGLYVVILGVMIYTGWSQGLAALKESLITWVLAKSALSAIGAILALAHPLAVVAAFVAALTSIVVHIGPGTAAAVVQAYIRPPVVRDFIAFGEDIIYPRRWWRNRVLKILLVFFLAGLGNTIGNYIGLAEAFSLLF